VIAITKSDLKNLKQNLVDLDLNKLKLLQIQALKDLFEPEFNRISSERNKNLNSSTKKIELEIEIQKLSSVISEMDHTKNKVDTLSKLQKERVDDIALSESSDDEER